MQTSPVATFKCKIDALKSERDSFEAKVKELELQLSITTESLEAKQYEIVSLNNQLQISEESGNLSDVKTKNTTVKLDDMTEKFEESTRQLNFLQMRNADLESLNDELKNKMSAMSLSQSTLEDDLADVNRKVTNLEDLNSRLEAREEELKKTLNKTTDELETLDRDYKCLSSRSLEDSNKEDEYERTIKNQRNRLNESDRKIEELLGHQTHMEDKISLLEESVNIERLNVRKLNETMSSTFNDINNL